MWDMHISRCISSIENWAHSLLGMRSRCLLKCRFPYHTQRAYDLVKLWHTLDSENSTSLPGRLWYRLSLEYRISNSGTETQFPTIHWSSMRSVRITISDPIFNLSLMQPIVCNSLTHQSLSHLPLPFLFPLLEYSYLTYLVNLLSLQYQFKCHFLFEDEW